MARKQGKGAIMKVLKKADNEIKITKPLMDLARENDVELYYDDVEGLLKMYSLNATNAFIEYKVSYSPYFMTDFVVVLFSTYEMEDAKNIPQTLKTVKDYKDLFQSIQLAFAI